MTRDLNGRTRRAGVLPGFSVTRDMLFHADVPDAAVATYFRALATFGPRPGVTGVDLGVKLVGHESDPDARLSIRVHVRRKESHRRVAAAERVPKRFEGMRTDVIQADYRRHHSSLAVDRRAKANLLQPGVSISHERGSVGTLGMLVRGLNADAPSVYILSADHVLADTGNPRPGDGIVQPGREDGGTEAIATLSRRSLLYDAAVARLTSTGLGLSNTAAETGDVIADADYPAYGIILKKSGLGTEVTQSQIVGIGQFEGLGPGMHLKPLATDVDDHPIVGSGDSGAIWYEEETGRAIGLHVRGNGVAALEERYAIATSVVKLCEVLRVNPRLG